MLSKAGIEFTLQQTDSILQMNCNDLLLSIEIPLLQNLLPPFQHTRLAASHLLHLKLVQSTNLTEKKKMLRYRNKSGNEASSVLKKP